MNNQYLFLFTIGPVQSFIAQARKTQDLYAGSKLLSDLIGYAIGELSKDKKVEEIIFPHFDKEKATCDKKDSRQDLQDEQDCQNLQKADNRSYPNRFIAKVNIEGDANKFGESIEGKVKKKLYQIAKDYLKEDYEKIIGVKEQIEDFLQVYWVIIPFEKEGKERNYQEVYKEIERYLGAVKNVRTFKQLHYQIVNGKKELGEIGRKCSLNGEYNVKFYRKSEKDKNEAHLLKSKLFIEKKEVQLFDYQAKTRHSSTDVNKEYDLIIQPGEGLSAISYLKRWYCRDIEKPRPKTFESTADICLMDTLHKIKENGQEGIKFLNSYIENFSKLDETILQETEEKLDGQLYFEENLTKDYFVKHGYKDPSKSLNEIKWLQKEIELYAKSRDLKLTKYYAILTFDGDSMGKWLSGDNLNQNSDLLEFHKALSEALGKFAQWATHYINTGSQDLRYGNNNDNPKGRTVYAGGDDFLAFVNLNHLFEVMQILRSKFDEMVNDTLRQAQGDNYSIKSDKNLTFSAGIAIAHYKVPLSIVLKEARKMQEEAKGIDDRKDAFGITVLKHSGETPSTVMKWNGCNSTSHAIKLISYLNEEKIKMSAKFIYDFHREFANLMNHDGKITELQNNNLIKVELSRLAQRKVPKEAQKEIKNFIEDDLFSLYSNSQEKTKDDLLNFINFLHICNFVAGHVNKDNFRQDLQDKHQCII